MDSPAGFLRDFTRAICAVRGNDMFISVATLFEVLSGMPDGVRNAIRFVERRKDQREQELRSATHAIDTPMGRFTRMKTLRSIRQMKSRNLFTGPGVETEYILNRSGLPPIPFSRTLWKLCSVMSSSGLAVASTHCQWAARHCS